MALLALVFCAKADNITEDVARGIAADFFNVSGHRLKAKDGNAKLTLARTTTGYYAFNRGENNGFVIVAANDNAANEVLGYADEGAIDGENLPENLQWWLDEYDRQMEYANSQRSATVAKTNRTAIKPLVKSKWNQDSPYYDKCPKYNGRQCYTGCVATSMAQIMRYYEWPTQGTGVVSYDWYVNNVKYKTIKKTLSSVTFAWDDMTDTYNSSSTDEAKEAVAQLMYCVGAASQMQYSPSGSATYTHYAMRGMVHNLGYDKGMTYALRNYYTHDEWDDLLYGELAASRPFYIAGCESSLSSSHAFLCDGYADGYYHINWGWGGTSDGYFLLSALNPDVQGAGGGGDGYSYEMEAVIGIQKPVDGSAFQPIMYLDNDFSTSSKNATKYTNVTFEGNIYYYGYDAATLTIGVKVVGSDGSVTYIKGAQGSFSFWSGLGSYNVSMSSFPTKNGTYDVYPAFYYNSTGKWYDVRAKVTTNAVSHVVATVKGDNITFGTPETEGSVSTIKATEISLPNALYAGKSFLGTAVCTASNGDYYGNVHWGFIKQGETSATTTDDDVSLVDLADGGSQTVKIASTAPSTAGDYYIVVLDAEGNSVSDKVGVTVKTAPTTTLAFTAMGLTMPQTTNVDPYNIEMTAKLKCTGGFYNDAFYVYLFEGNNSSSSTYLVSERVTVAEGDEVTVEFMGEMPALVPSTTYTAYLCYVNGSYASYITPYNKSSISFTTAATTGIENVTADGRQEIAIYTLSGTLIDRQNGEKANLEKLPRGVYVVKSAKGTKKVLKK